MAMNQHARDTRHRRRRRPPLWRRFVRSTRQLVVVVVLCGIVLALGTTAVTGAARKGDGPAPPSVEEHVAVLAESAASVGADAPDDVVRALEAHPALVGPPERVEPYFDWIPEVEPAPAPIAPATDLESLSERLDDAARATMGLALTVEVDREAADAAGATVPAERVRTLVAVGMEQLEALARLDPEAAAAVHEDLLTAGEPEGVAVTAEQCEAVASAARTAYRLAYLYEYAAVRREAPRPQEAPDDEDDPARWWAEADERARLGDQLADLLPNECSAMRESAYPTPADDELTTALGEAESELALALRDAAAAADPDARPALIARAFDAVHHVAGDDWFELAATAAQ